MPCDHENFKADFGVGRLTSSDGRPVTHYITEICVRCADCGEQFQWQGLPLGSSAYRPTVSMDGYELRAPIMPTGQRPPEGLPGFCVSMSGEPND